MYKYWFVHKPVLGNVPKVKHDSYKSAADEARRLAQLNPGVKFFVLEAVSAFVTETPKVTEVALETEPDTNG